MRHAALPRRDEQATISSKQTAPSKERRSAKEREEKREIRDGEAKDKGE